MPTISMFYGIIIRMYYAPKEHWPAKQIRLVSAWIEIHRKELLADWKLCQNGQKPFKIQPLK